MTLMYVAVVVGVIGLTVLALFALRLFRVVQAFGKEVARVSGELNTATQGLQAAANAAPPREPRRPDA